MTEHHPGTCRCGRAWHSLTEAHCRTCHRHFGSVDAFDRHHPGRTDCPDPSSLRSANGNPVLRLVDRANGPTWITWKSDEQRAAVRETFARRRREAVHAHRQAPNTP